MKKWIRRTPTPTPNSLWMGDRIDIVDKESTAVKGVLLWVLNKIQKLDSLLVESHDLNSGAVRFSWSELSNMKLNDLDAYLNDVILQFEQQNTKAKEKRRGDLESML